MRTYNIFISHSWKYDEHYESIVNFLNERKYFDWKDYSVPNSDPIHNAPTDTLLRQALNRKIIPCSIVIILAGKYSTYSKWIKEEIEIAKSLNKPIVAIIPRGNETPSKIVLDNATEVVSWNVNPIVNAIKNNAL